VIFEVAGEALDVDPSDVEQVMVVLQAPGGELAQVQGVGVAGEAPVAGEETEQCHLLFKTGSCRSTAVVMFAVIGATSSVVAEGPDHGADSTPGRSELQRYARAFDAELPDSVALAISLSPPFGVHVRRPLPALRSRG